MCFVPLSLHYYTMHTCSGSADLPFGGATLNFLHLLHLLNSSPSSPLTDDHHSSSRSRNKISAAASSCVSYRSKLHIILYFIVHTVTCIISCNH